jgi:peptidoglycan/xylan/chitin deacetylase (PgdA/CDA1 family)
VPEPALVTRFDSIRPRGWRGRGRSAALSLLARWDQIAGGDALRRPRVQLIYLHHVLEDEVEPFRGLVGALARDYTFLTYSEAVDRVLDGPIDRPYLAFSFDDGLGSCVAAARVLEEFGARACFFLCPPVIGLTEPAAVRRFCQERLGLPAMALLDWGAVERLVEAGHEVGAHTLGHYRVADLEPARVVDEVHGSKEQLERRLGPVSHFAWPFGRFTDFSAVAAGAVRDAGFRSLASAERGCHVAPAGPLADQACLRRDHVIARDPPAHLRWFCSRNARRASPEDSLQPAAWSAPGRRIPA